MATQLLITEDPPRQAQEPARAVWGVIGGMGPLASAEFIKTIYELGQEHREQDRPRVMLVSDPTVPDRTECFQNGRGHILAKRLEASMRRFASFNVTQIIVCCLTIHHVVHLLPASLQRKVLSLVEVILSDVIHRKRMHLLLCTSGSRDMRLFESHALWKQAAKYIAMPSPSDQQAVHQLIYRIKENGQSGSSDFELLRALTSRYQADSLIAGCTELHLMAKKTQASLACGIQWLDPLLIAASHIVHGASGQNSKKRQGRVHLKSSK